MFQIRFKCLNKSLINQNLINQNLRQYHSVQRTASQLNNLIQNTRHVPKLTGSFKWNNKLSLSSLFIIQDRFNSSISKSVKESVESLKNLDSDVIDLSDFQIPHLPTPEEIQSMKAVVSIIDLGLTPWLPPGLLFQLFEYLYKSGFEWPVTIIVSTIIVRSLLLPIMISARRDGVQMNNFMRLVKQYQDDLDNAQLRGNLMDMNKLSLKYSDAFESEDAKRFMKRGRFAMIKMPLLQGFVFISFFMTLRKMAYYPMPSLYESSFLWLPSLAEKDPYYLLPVITSTTLFLTLKMGIETGSIGSNTNKVQKAIVYVLPFASLFFTYNFPSALCLYWCTANFYSLAVAFTLKIPKVKNYFKIPDMQIDEKESKSKISIIKIKDTVKDFKKAHKTKGIKDKFKNMDLKDKESFNEAGKGALVKTYKYDPTKFRK